MKYSLAIVFTVVFFHPLSLAGLYVGELNNSFEEEFANEPKPKIAYTVLQDKESGRICYIEAFGREDIVPDFAEPADYELADGLEPPSFPECSEEEEVLVAGYRDHSYLSLDLAYFQLAAGLLANIAICSTIAYGNYYIFQEIAEGFSNKETPKDTKIVFEDIRYLFIFPNASFAILFSELIHYSFLAGHYVRNKVKAPSLAHSSKPARIGHTAKSLRLSQARVQMAASRMKGMSILGIACGLLGGSIAIYHFSTEHKESDLE